MNEIKELDRESEIIKNQFRSMGIRLIQEGKVPDEDKDSSGGSAGSGKESDQEINAGTSSRQAIF